MPFLVLVWIGWMFLRCILIGKGIGAYASSLDIDLANLDTCVSSMDSRISEFDVEFGLEGVDKD